MIEGNDKYLTIRQLSEKYGQSKSFWRNHIKRGTFKRGTHYLQPYPGGPITFNEKAIDRWWRGDAEKPVNQQHNDLIDKLLA